MHRYLIKNKKTPWFGVISVMAALLGTGFSFVMSHLLDLAHDGSDNELVFFIFFSIAYVFITVAAEFLFSFTKCSIIRDAMVNVKNDIFKSVLSKSISELPAGFIYSKIAYLSQIPSVFEDTIRNNICLFDETISDEDLRIVTQKAGLTKFIEALPDGIDTPLSELGENISGGERQRICLARTLLFDKDIILLDEFENNLDAETRCLVENSILAMDDKLVIAASHDVSDDHKRKYDIIYTVDNKNVALQG